MYLWIYGLILNGIFYMEILNLSQAPDNHILWF